MMVSVIRAEMAFFLGDLGAMASSYASMMAFAAEPRLRARARARAYLFLGHMAALLGLKGTAHAAWNSARELGASLGEEILQQIAQQTSVARNRRSTRIGQVDAGTLRVGRDARSSQSRTAIASQIATRIRSKIAPVTSRNKG